MSIFSSYKKIFLLGFIIVILIAIPFSVYLAQKRQQTTTKAAASTVLSFEPALATTKVGDILVLNIMLDPGVGTSANQVSFVKLSINFDPAKFTTLPTDSLKPSPESSNTLTTILDGPTYDNAAGKATLSLSIGADPTKAVTTKTKIAILQLKATNSTTPTTPNITFDSAPNTQVLSIASSDQTSENVLSTTIPAKVTVTSTAVTITPTSIPVTSAPGSPGLPPPSSSSLTPVCSILGVNGLTNGTAPYPLTFTATGSDSDGTITKISFNFGDSIEDLTTGGGIGTSSVSGQLLHTYKTPGIYTAYAILTDNTNNLSVQQPSCTKTITITGLQTSPTIITQPLPPPGNGKIIFGLGAIGIIFTIIGSALLRL
ncbi:MAG: hypothetical protein A3B47_04655 [Candidatus Levybacteria bacterium RIFCSPLOWO2_01_FULL_39_24]|nr:MAG: hypothetical protein A2800_04025 [Candidatus Levybacteria bacterium RIFCSPHIGHO2_01_FULL_40_16]OGH46735.1 MAG: hypothetical protein A3B47_04655 [Candidatus Levybacteria bacterium RIFCSPLOWO2_01_FULL_39_24]